MNVTALVAAAILMALALGAPGTKTIPSHPSGGVHTTVSTADQTGGAGGTATPPPPIVSGGGPG